MKHRIRIEYADGRNQRFDLTGDLVSLGRGEHNDVPLADPLVSRRHLLLRVVGETVVAEDQGATHGTRVNGESLAPGVSRPLQSGDVIQLGLLKLSIEGDRSRRDRDPHGRCAEPPTRPLSVPEWHLRTLVRTEGLAMHRNPETSEQPRVQPNALPSHLPSPHHTNGSFSRGSLPWRAWTLRSTVQLTGTALLMAAVAWLILAVLL